MREVVLKTVNLSKNFKDVQVLKDISIELERGKIYGFIGLNGAGKTTLMRILMGLVKSDSGQISLFNESKEQLLSGKRKRIGSMIETPAYYPEMNARENLDMARFSHGLPNKGLVEELLKMVGLENDCKKKVRDFSLGMKQRLRIAQALLCEPDMLILDEPNNGLDPFGVVEVRELLLKMNREKNVTMLISSHTLQELYQLVTDYIIIHEGVIIESISKKELQEKCQRHIYLRVKSPFLATATIEKYLDTTNYQVLPDQSIKLYDYLDDLNRVITCLVQHDIEIFAVTIAEETLEDYFVQSIRGMGND
ncbi:ATP-binding cassette domain-containing protein [Enterococcus malodoratus]|uniref:ATP-binding cassette domain-containing protein n=1 Tax=Enterococcus malodoratus TaxID=71451 RepID=UPI0020736861|nr:ATP-binding cassette domain-containing protein [Enterococcus malodoratus]